MLTKLAQINWCQVLLVMLILFQLLINHEEKQKMRTIDDLYEEYCDWLQDSLCNVYVNEYYDKDNVVFAETINPKEKQNAQTFANQLVSSASDNEG